MFLCVRARECVRACACVCRYTGAFACADARVGLPSMQSTCAEVHCHLWPLWLHHIFPHYLINGTIFGKKDIEHEICVFSFCRAFI